MRTQPRHWIEQWDNHILHQSIVLKELRENEWYPIGRCSLEEYDGYLKLQGLYVDPEFRKQYEYPESKLTYGYVLVRDVLQYFWHVKQPVWNETQRRYDYVPTPFSKYDKLYIMVNKAYDRLIKWYEGFGFKFNSNAQDENYIWMEIDRITLSTKDFIWK